MLDGTRPVLPVSGASTTCESTGTNIQQSLYRQCKETYLEHWKEEQKYYLPPPPERDYELARICLL